MIDNFNDYFSPAELLLQVKNYEYALDNLRARLYKLTGCRNFGGCDGMDASCHYCLEERKELFDRCWEFKYGKVNKE